MRRMSRWIAYGLLLATARPLNLASTVLLARLRASAGRPGSLSAQTSIGVVFLASPSHAQDNLVASGSFASDVDGDGEPDHWSTSGVAGIEQTLITDTGPDAT